MKLMDILRVKGTTVYCITPSATLADVVQKLVEHKIGSLVVREDLGPRLGRVLGIITERDVLKACARGERPLCEQAVAECMTNEIVTGSPLDSIDETMGLMTEHRIRHLPVMDGEELKGMISIGDVVKAHHHMAVVENHYLKSYIQS
ncbi:MAG: CBS domain-containing protein [Planctomycetales bacterium]|nr:CBS domain-containing protein [Planctomycetales bacterium]MBN8625349.1 CBS domain-containing protein [Planctomycetota bacterium]